MKSYPGCTLLKIFASAAACFTVPPKAYTNNSDALPLRANRSNFLFDQDSLPLKISLNAFSLVFERADSKDAPNPPCVIATGILDELCEFWTLPFKVN